MSFDLETIRRALNPDFGMGWNLFLALAPLAMALVLFRVGRRPGLLWWPGLVVFCLFLPNAAYVLTDTLHLVHRIRREPLMPVWTVSLVLIPQYALFMLAGLQSHVLSLMRFGDYLRWLGWGVLVVPMELTLNLAASLGIFLGRFQRFNSWDVVNQPERLAFETIDDLLGRFPLEIMGITFAVLTILYYSFKVVDRALLAGWGFSGQTAGATQASQ
jgi:uncharacterized membrane protein